MQNQLEELTNECMRFCSSKRIEAVNCEIARDGVSISLFRIRPTPEFNYKCLCPLCE